MSEDTPINLSPNPYALKRTTETNPYAPYNATGTDYLLDDKGNRRWPSVVEMLAALVGDINQPAEARERAAEVLKIYAETVSGVADYPRPAGVPQSIIDGDIVVAKMFGQMNADMLWFAPEDCIIRQWPQNTDRQSIHPLRSVMSKKFHLHTPVETPGPIPTPGPMPEFTPAVPLPVLPPSDVETQAIKESSSTFDDRYSPRAVAARVAAIEKEAAQMRASRERTE
jgi:hypothetical protein